MVAAANGRSVDTGGKGDAVAERSQTVALASKTATVEKYFMNKSPDYDSTTALNALKFQVYLNIDLNKYFVLRCNSSSEYYDLLTPNGAHTLPARYRSMRP